MARLQVRTLDEAASTRPPQDRAPGVETLGYFDAESDAIQLRLHRLAPGASLQLTANDTDLSVYVWRGSLHAGAVRFDPRSSAIVEAGGTLELTAEGDGAEVLVFNGERSASTDAAEGRVHLLPADRTPRTFAMGGQAGVGGALHADAISPSPRVWLHENDYAMADKQTDVHSHSEDEVIFIREGTMRFGTKLYGPGTALFIAADTRYGFFSGDDGLSFVNFRGSSPTYTSADGSLVLDEAELWRKAVGAPQYL